MQKFGDVIRYTRNGQEMNAIVLGARMIDGVEHISLAYPNADVAGQMLTAGNVSKSTLVAFDVKPMADGANSGWKPVATNDTAPSNTFATPEHDGEDAALDKPAETIQ